MLQLNEKDVIRIEVEAYGDRKDSQIKKIAFDPRLTNYEVLIGLIIKAFNIKQEFLIHYLVTEDFGVQFHLPLLSDWDLDTAILTASDPILYLKVCIKHIEKDNDEWQTVAPSHSPPKPNNSNLTVNDSGILEPYIGIESIAPLSDVQKTNRSNSVSLLSQMYEKTVNSVQRVFSYSKVNDLVHNKVMKSPMSDSELKNYMDDSGRLIHVDKFRKSVYIGGLEPSVRKVGWSLLLNLCPIRSTGCQRLSLLRNKTKQYQSLKHGWKQRFKLGKLSESEMTQIALVCVDVVRTDKSLNFYSSENNQQHVCQLFDILATYCICHPSIGYYQGMSDLASPLLFVQHDEAIAYVCFCSLMARVNNNFVTKPNSNNYLTSNNGSHCGMSNITDKLKHFYQLLLHIDRELALFFRKKHIDNLYFAHRWILLEMKREFSFYDSLRLLEVQWASLPQCESMQDDVPLREEDIFDFLEPRPTKLRCYGVHDMTLICSLVGSQYTPCQSLMSSPYSSPMIAEYRGHDQLTNVDINSNFVFQDFEESNPIDSIDIFISNQNDGRLKHENDVTKSKPSFFDYNQNYAEEHCVDDDLFRLNALVTELPGPTELGYGNPFLLFLGVSLLLEYRDHILKSVNDVSDIILLYQKLKRRHNTVRVLNRARELFDHYLRDQDKSRK